MINYTEIVHVFDQEELNARNIVDVLANVSLQEKTVKTDSLWNLRRVFQYALTPEHSLISYNNRFIWDIFVCHMLTLYAIIDKEVLHSEQKQVFRSELASTASGS